MRKLNCRPCDLAITVEAQTGARIGCRVDLEGYSCAQFNTIYIALWKILIYRYIFHYQSSMNNLLETFVKGL